MLLHGPPAEAGRVNAERNAIAEGDMVIVYERPDSMKAAKVKAAAMFNNRFDHFAMKTWVGKPFGSRVTGSRGGWVYLLRPTSELWTKVLSHRTQILYVADISMVAACLDLAPGAVVVESGTGSGSLTTALARAVAPSGHVHTFEHHQGRAEAAAAEFASNGIAPVVTVAHRDVEGTGFPDSLHEAADGVFLDLPAPWKATASALACLAPNGAFVSFSPCIEQVQKTCEALHAAGGVRLKTFECILRVHETAPLSLATDLDTDPPRAVGNSRKRKQAGTVLAAAHSKSQSLVAAKPALDAKGHTGYLLTARKGVPLDGT